MVVELLTMSPSGPCASVRFVRSGVKWKVSEFATLCIVFMTEPALHRARPMRVCRRYASVVTLTALTACGDNTTNPSPDATGGGGQLTLVFQPSNPPSATGLSLTQAHVTVEAVAVIGDTTPDYRTMLNE